MRTSTHTTPHTCSADGEAANVPHASLSTHFATFFMFTACRIRPKTTAHTAKAQKSPQKPSKTALEHVRGSSERVHAVAPISHSPLSYSSGFEVENDPSLPSSRGLFDVDGAWRRNMPKTRNSELRQNDVKALRPFNVLTPFSSIHLHENTSCSI